MVVGEREDGEREKKRTTKRKKRFILTELVSREDVVHEVD